MKRTQQFSGKTPSPKAGKHSLYGLYGVLASLLIVAAGLVAYYNSFDGPFVFDDQPSILLNPTIKQLCPIGPVLTPPGEGRTVQGRPLVNLSLAINWAIGQKSVQSYHILNLAIHLAAGLVLFGVIRQTLRQPCMGERLGQAATGIALAAALIWTVHPLQTESVTYIVQRAESIMGLFYLLTLYCVIRGAGSSKSVIWYILSVLACLCGMASKEVMVTAPLVVLLYDRTFLAGSFRGAIRQRWPLYVALACTWGMLAYLVFASMDRGGTAGFGLSMTPWQYAMTQLGYITRYLGLSFWPSDLVFDYGWSVTNTVGEILPGAIVIGLLLAATIWALIRHPVAGFLGACFFLILSPSSSFIPVVTEAAAEHRMYLPLAAVVALAVTLPYLAWQWFWDRIPPQRRPAGAMWALPITVAAIVAAALAYGTFERNKDYMTELSIWQDAVTKRPDNARANNNVGKALVDLGKAQDAIPYCERALQLKPDYPEAEGNMGLALADTGNAQAAITHYERSLQLKPNFAATESNLGAALIDLHRPQDAIPHLERALQLQPDLSAVENNLGTALIDLHRPQDAIPHLERALQLKPNFPVAQNSLGRAMIGVGRSQDAIPHLERSLQLKPNYPDAENNLGIALAIMGHTQAAIAHFERAIKIKPNSPEAENNLGLTLADLGRSQDAIEHFERALQLKPDYIEARNNLAKIKSSKEK